MMDTAADNNRLANILSFATLYKDCVESFCLIHQGKKEWNRKQRLLMAKIGVEQGKLLAWSQIMGVCELGEYRDSRLDEPATFSEVEAIVKCMLDRLVNVDHGVQLATYGLKPSKKSSDNLEPALDSTRLESFREQYMLLPNAQYATLEKATHWTISDDTKFETFVADTRNSVNQLIQLMEVEELVEECLKQDIKAMGWHPVFDRVRAANDGSKLRLIKESCKVEQPIYSEAADLPLAYLNTQWSDSYNEMMDEKYPNGNPHRTEMSTNGLIEEQKTKKEKSTTGDTSPRKQSLVGMLSKLRSHSWHRRSPTQVAVEGPPRSKSLAHPATIKEDGLYELSTERSMSEGGTSTRP